MNKHLLHTCRTVIDALADTEPQPPGGPTNPTAWRSSVTERLRQQHWNTIRTQAEAGHPAATIAARIGRLLGTPATDPHAGQQAAFNERCTQDAAALADQRPGTPMPDRTRNALPEHIRRRLERNPR